MNKREKILVMLVGVAGLLFGGRMVAKMYQQSIADKDRKIQTLRGDLATIAIKRLESEAARQKWTEFGAQTLSMDPNEAANRLRDGLFELTRRTTLRKEQVQLGQARQLKNSPVRVLQCTVTAEGAMSNMAQFLFALYRAPFVVRCTSLRLEQLTGKDNQGMLKMTAKLETLLLAKLEKVPSIVPAKLEKDPKPVKRTLFDSMADYNVIANRKMWERYVEPPPEKATNPMPVAAANSVSQSVELTWTAGKGAETHKIFFGTTAPGEVLSPQSATKLMRSGLLAQTTYFWRVDEIGPGGTTIGDVWSFKTGGTPSIAKAAPPPPPPSKPPDDENLVLTRILSSPRGQQAVLEDAIAAQSLNVSTPRPAPRPMPGNPGAPNPGRVPSPGTPTPPAPAPVPTPGGAPTSERRIEVGETMYGGTLVFVHPKGAVTERDGNLRFHPLGVALKEAQPLTESDQPEVFHEFKKLQARAAGISERPG